MESKLTAALAVGDPGRPGVPNGPPGPGMG